MRNTDLGTRGVSGAAAPSFRRRPKTSLSVLGFGAATPGAFTSKTAAGVSGGTVSKARAAYFESLESGSTDDAVFFEAMLGGYVGATNVFESLFGPLKSRVVRYEALAGVNKNRLVVYESIAAPTKSRGTLYESLRAALNSDTNLYETLRGTTATHICVVEALMSVATSDAALIESETAAPTIIKSSTALIESLQGVTTSKITRFEVIGVVTPRQVVSLIESLGLVHSSKQVLFESEVVAGAVGSGTPIVMEALDGGALVVFVLRGFEE